MALAAGCRRATASEVPDAAPSAGSPAPPPAPPSATRAPAPPPSRSAVDGPHELPLAPGRPIFYAFPAQAAQAAPPTPDAGPTLDATPRPYRLVGHLHGVCGPPSYACGKWIGAAVEVGALVCPTGNAKCGDSPVGPPSWEAPTWQELVVMMDHDLDESIAKVSAKHPGALRKDGAVLTGYSRGAYAAPVLARMHPGRWPYLVLIEANVPLSAEGLRKSGVRAVALVAGETGTEIAGERKTADDLTRDGFAARLFVMPKTGHLYSDDMEQIMRDALAFVLSTEHADASAP